MATSSDDSAEPAARSPAIDRRTAGWLAASVVFLLAPFLGKPVHIDDPLFVWTARQILKSPFHFFDFEVNWLGATTPVTQEFMNPPLTSFWLALFGGPTDFSEVAMHIGMLVPAVAAALGSYAIASRYCDRPLMATGIAIVSPVFLVSSTTLMAELPMLAFWCWSLYFWDRGLDDGSTRDLLLAGLLAGLCAWTKFAGAALIPLMVLAAITKRRGVGPWLYGVALATAMVAAYQAYSGWLYDQSPLMTAGQYSVDRRGEAAGGVLDSVAVGLSFLGGSVVSLLFVAPRIVPRGALLIGSGVAVLAALSIAATGSLGTFDLSRNAGVSALVLAHWTAFALSGGIAVGLAIAELVRPRDPDGWVLFAWLIGLVVFATWINWTTNARTLIAAAPAIGILAARARSRRRGMDERERLVELVPLVPAALLALIVCSGDVQRAEADASAAQSIHRTYGGSPAQLWYQGAWGFYYYMDALGADKVDIGTSVLQPGDVLAIPLNGADTGAAPPLSMAPVIALDQIDEMGWATTMHSALGAGFYSNRWGPLPFAVGPIPPELYQIRSVRKVLRPKRARAKQD